MTDLVTKEFDFMDRKVVAVEQDQMWYFSPRHFCENIGLNWPGQQKKIRDNTEKFSCMDIHTTGKDGKHYKMLMIPATRMDTWIMSISPRKIKDLNKREIVEAYQSQLSDWLYARKFLTREEVAAVESVALSRGAVGLTPEIDSLISLPAESPGMSQWRESRIIQLTDEHLGFISSTQIGRKERLTPNAFHQRWVIENSCDDRMMMLFPELTNTLHIHKYAVDHGMFREEISQISLGFSQKARLAKGHIQFNQSIGQLVVTYNYPASLIHKSIWETNCFLIGVFYQNEVDLGPDPIDWEERKIRYRRYTRDTEQWRIKRDAFFAVFNCCVDCGLPHGWEIVSRNFELHHRHYQTVGREHPHDLVPLCGTCHQAREKKRKRSFVLE
jgi:hypothetical protein